MAIPDDMPGRIYTPRTYYYSVGCNNIDMITLMTGTYVFGPKGCAQVMITLDGPINYNVTAGAIVTTLSNSRWSITLPNAGVDFISELSPVVRANHNGTTCAIADNYRALSWTPGNGLTSFPSTILTKCVYPSGDITALSTTSIRFMTTEVQQFENISKTVVDEYDGLFQAMEVTLNNNTIKGNSTLFVELESANGTINLLSCLTAPNPDPTANNTEFLNCMYNIIDVIILERQDINPIIAAALGGAPLTTPPEFTKIMTFTHIPSVNDNNSIQVSSTGLKIANSDVAKYLASLGQNLYIDWDLGQVTVIYDTTDAERGLEIPLWLIICVPTIAIISFILLVSTEYFLDGRYTSSLYKAIAMPMSSRMNTFAPMLMRSKVDPVQFEGIPVVPSGHHFEADPKNVATLRSETNSSSTTLNNGYSSNKLNW
ncbi:hypothetical protein BGZ49_003972 [Haplosporangium sp. Z 27]|nr:hypothetical protein BGZ49_003972 [Haplosporangium sp. Z 27]